MSDLKISGQTSFPKIFSVLERSFGAAWREWEPETVLFETSTPSALLAEKVAALQVVCANPLYAFSLPEFMMWFTSLANNEPAEFETVSMPTSLELGWALYQARRLCLQMGKPWIDSAVSPESEEASYVKAIQRAVSYLLTEDGFQGDFSDSGLTARIPMDETGLPEVNASHTKALKAYIHYMETQNA